MASANILLDSTSICSLSIGLGSTISDAARKLVPRFFDTSLYTFFSSLLSTILVLKQKYPPLIFSFALCLPGSPYLPLKEYKASKTQNDLHYCWARCSKAYMEQCYRFPFAHEYYYRNSYKKRTYDSLCHNKCSESDSIVKANKTEKKTGKQTVNGIWLKVFSTCQYNIGIFFCLQGCVIRSCILSICLNRAVRNLPHCPIIC